MAADPSPELVDELDEDLLDLFAEDTVARIERLVEALDRGDAAVTADQAHAVKGGSLTVGLGALAGAAERLEDRARSGDLAAAAAELGAVRAAFEGFQAARQARRH